MSSPITFSGFNDIDFNMVLNALMTQASGPLTSLQNRQQALRSQLTAFDTFRSRIETVRSAAAALGSIDSISTMAATSSDHSIVSAASTSNAAAGSYAVVVSSLARAQVTASAETFANSDTTIVASGGSITIASAEVTIAGDTTLDGLAAAINATEDIGVTASVVRTGPDGYRLALTSQHTGTAHAFTVTNNLTGGAGLSFGANAVTASDAVITINNITSTSSSNTFENVVTGVTLTVLRADPATVTVNVASDGSALTSKVEAFVAAYNDIAMFLDTQRTAAGASNANSIGNDPLLRQLKGNLRTQLLGEHGSDTLTRLSQVGIAFSRDGRLELDKAAFNEAIAADADQVRELFAGSEGAFPAIGAMLQEYTMATGMISAAKDRLNRQISTMDTQILSMQSRLALQRDSLQRQFAEADLAMSRLKNQSSSLSGIASRF